MKCVRLARMLRQQRRIGPECRRERKDRPVRTPESRLGQKDRSVKTPGSRLERKDRPVRPLESRLVQKDRPVRSPRPESRPRRSPEGSPWLECRPGQAGWLGPGKRECREKFQKSRSQIENLFRDVVKHTYQINRFIIHF